MIIIYGLATSLMQSSLFVTSLYCSGPEMAKDHKSGQSEGDILQYQAKPWAWQPMKEVLLSSISKLTNTFGRVTDLQYKEGSWKKKYLYQVFFFLPTGQHNLTSLHRYHTCLELHHLHTKEQGYKGVLEETLVTLTAILGWREQQMEGMRTVLLFWDTVILLGWRRKAIDAPQWRD